MDISKNFFSKKIFHNFDLEEEIEEEEIEREEEINQEEERKEIKKNQFQDFSSFHQLNHKKQQISWNQERVELMLSIAVKYRAHIKGKSLSMKEKWKLVADELMLHNSFQNGVRLNSGTLMKKYDRLKTDFTDSHFSNKEGVNLSSLTNKYNDSVFLLMFQMIQEEEEVQSMKITKNKILNQNINMMKI